MEESNIEGEIAVKKDQNIEEKLFLVFTIEGEEMAIPIEEVKEIIPTPSVAQIPQPPNMVIGAINVRGIIYAVVDLRSGGGSIDSQGFVIVIKKNSFKIALYVEKLPETQTFVNPNLEPVSKVMGQSSESLQYMRGIIRIESRMIVVLDLDALYDGEVND